MWESYEQHERTGPGTTGPGAGQIQGTAGAANVQEGVQPALAPRPFLQQLHSGMDDMLAMMGKIQKLYGGFKQMEPILKWVAGGLDGKAKTSSKRRGGGRAHSKRKRSSKRK